MVTSISTENILSTLSKYLKKVLIAMFRVTVCLSWPNATRHVAPSSQHWYHATAWFRRLFSTDVNWDRTGTVDDVVTYVKAGRAERVVVMAGAGISTPSGMPDFRSPGTGLYDNLQKYNLPYPEAVFDLRYFYTNPKPFYMLAKELYPRGVYRPNVAHYFVRLLHERGILRRMYTQNIDGLERLAGLPEDKLVEAHGTFATATCLACAKNYLGSDLEDAIFEGRIAHCTRPGCKGVVKPDIVFFGEQLPTRFSLCNTDLPQADLLIVMGSSLEIQPFANISEEVLPGVPRLLFNMTATGPFVHRPRHNDVISPGDLTHTVADFCNRLGWKQELDQLMDKSEMEAKLKRTPKTKPEE